MRYGIIGALIYALVMYFNKGFDEVFGKDVVDKVLKKIHLKRS